MTNVTLPMNTRARILAPGDAGFDVASRPWNLAVDQRPALVALPRHASDVAEIVIGAQAAGQQVAVQGGAHNPAPLGDLAHSVLIRTSAMDEVVIDPVRRIARVGAGALWSPVVEAAAAHGLYPLHGSSPDVGVVGYSLGGGVGWAARRHGLQADRIRAIELVTAGGSPLRVDERHDPDVFWALRGGGGGFGIVTAIEFELLPITSAYAGWLAWDWDESERVLGVWAEWAEGAPEAVTSAARILQLPPLPDIPEPLRGRRLVVIDGAVLADTADATRILGPLRTLRPEIDTFATLPAAALARLHGDPEAPVPVVSDHEMLGRLDPAAIATLVRVAGPSPARRSSRPSCASSAARSRGPLRAAARSTTSTASSCSSPRAWPSTPTASGAAATRRSTPWARWRRGQRAAATRTSPSSRRTRVSSTTPPPTGGCRRSGSGSTPTGSSAPPTTRTDG